MLTVTYAECQLKAPYAEWRYAECCYAECRGAIYTAFTYLYRNEIGNLQSLGKFTISKNKFSK
jgi:hypothetical protein